MYVHSSRRVICKSLGPNIFNIRSSSAEACVNNEALESVKPWKAVPGPSSLPIIGQIHHFLPTGFLYNLKGRDLGNILYKNYGPIVRVEAMFGRPRFLYLFEPTSAALVLRGENWVPRRPTFQSLDYYRMNVKHMKEGEMGLLSDQGEGWKKLRSTVNPVLLQPKTIKLYEKQIKEVAEDMIKRMKSKLDENNMIKENLLSELNLWSLESIAVIALGGRLNCLDTNLPANSPVLRLINCVEELFTKFDELNFGFSIWRYYPTKLFKEAMKSYEELHNITNYFIEIAKREFQKEKDESQKGVLQKLLEIDENMANIMATEMLFAGVDTTSNNVINLMYYLATNPDKQEKLREEVLSGSDNKYLSACLKESARLMPIASLTLRQINKDYNIMGYTIPKDTVVFMYHHNMTLSEDQYPRPYEFIPERWIVNKEDPLSYKNAQPFVYNPFGFGVRACIGKRIAEMEMEAIVSNMIQNFKLDWVGPPLKVESHFLNYAAPPFNFKYNRLQ